MFQIVIAKTVSRILTTYWILITILIQAVLWILLICTTISLIKHVSITAFDVSLLGKVIFLIILYVSQMKIHEQQRKLFKTLKEG